MKRLLRYTILFISIMIIVPGCSKDPLDITPDGRITIKEVFKEDRLIGAYVNSIYGYIRLYGSVYYPNTMLAVFSDEAHDSDDPQDSWANSSQWYGGMLTPTYNPLDAGTNRESGIKWNGQYYEDSWAAIRKANVFLTEIKNATMADKGEQARMIAEVKVLRAFFFLELIKMYGGMPIIREPLPDDFDYTKLKRNSFEECAAFIAADCNEAIAESALPYRISIEGERGRFTKAVAHAVKSEALLFSASKLWNQNNDLEKWKSAASAAKSALDALLANDYRLHPNYEKYFQGSSLNSDDKETIFEIKNPNAVYGGNLFFLHGIPSIDAGKAGATPSQELVDTYDMANGQQAILGYQDADHLKPIINTASGYDDNKPYVGRDPRFYATVWYNQAFYGNIWGNNHYVASFIGGIDGLANLRSRTHNGYYLRKFIDPVLRNGNIGNVRWKKYRLAELYLNYAEAANEAYGATSEVYDAIYAIRDRVAMDGLPVGLDVDQMRERIRRERQVELAFEEHRFWDVRRWKVLDKTDKLTTGIAWTKTGTVFTGKRIVVDRRLAWDNKFLIFPIPLLEISRLPAFDQNPGW
ncbi:MAG: RagB/SusD family nutrient uptake outer membrane protein [Pedobacter sp.]|nr:MAG: RagB/SusD family nutrient uptake outer membrane protein [Pedobacter sp.]